jgi:DNA-binding transcriptional MerR regulator
MKSLLIRNVPKNLAQKLKEVVAYCQESDSKLSQDTIIKLMLEHESDRVLKMKEEQTPNDVPTLPEQERSELQHKLSELKGQESNSGELQMQGLPPDIPR